MPSPETQRWTAIFTKRPLPGRVKTRLCPPLTPEQAARLAEAMLRDTVAKCLNSSGFRTLLVYAEDGPWFRAEFPELERQFSQEGDGLGARLANFVAGAFSEEASGQGRVGSLVLIGSDQPLVPSRLIAEAHEALEAGEDCVLGPDLGGGYYLIGLRASHPALFREVPMSTAGMCAATARLAQSRGLSVHWLETCYDIDHPRDLERLQVDLEALQQSGAGELADFPAHTRAFLRAQPFRRTAVP